MGICASAGGPFNNYAIIQGVDKIFPVDVYVPGCPPRPEGLLFALEKLRQKQAKETFRQYREQPGYPQVTTPSDIESLDQLRSRQPA
jgi:NADH-quinone oxidoreductase subunit B